jgi:hypothetical protein
MQESGGRRVDKSIKLDMNTLQLCTNETMARIRQEIPLMKEVAYREGMTNAQLYRIYIEKYLSQHPIVNTNLDLIIAQREPTQFGVPIEVYFFLSDKVWNEFERIQSDIFDHLLVMAKAFDLKLYQLDTPLPKV